MKPRKIIQVSAAMHGEDMVIVALCSDGTIWKQWAGNTKWHRVDTSDVETRVVQK